MPRRTKEVRVQAPTADLERWRDNFAGFATQLDIIPKGGARQKLRPNAIQSAFELTRSGRDIVLKPRQVGLTTWELARDVWYFLTRRGARVVVVCQSMADDAAIKELADKLRVMFESLRSAGVQIPGLDASTTQWLIPSRDASLKIIGAGASAASAKKKGRSGTIHRLHVTELAFFEHADATLNALLECVPGPEYGAEICLESTANGAAGWFYEAYQDAKGGRSSFRSHFFHWLEQAEYSIPLAADEHLVPETDRERAVVKAGATPAQLKWYRQKVADKKSQEHTDQEYPIDEETCWLTAGRLFFDRERTKQLYAEASEPIEVVRVGREGVGELRIWTHPNPARRYLIAVDPSEGTGGDPGAAVILDRGTGQHVASIHGQFPTWEMAKIVADAGKQYAFRRPDGQLEPALVIVERNNHGHAVLQGLVREQRYTNLFIGPDKRPGWVTTEVSRAAALEALHNAHLEKHWASPEKQSLAEMLRFVVLENGRAEAAKGAHDDLVLAHAIGWDVACRPVVERYVPQHHLAR